MVRNLERGIDQLEMYTLERFAVGRVGLGVPTARGISIHNPRELRSMAQDCINSPKRSWIATWKGQIVSYSFIAYKECAAMKHADDPTQDTFTLETMEKLCLVRSDAGASLNDVPVFAQRPTAEQREEAGIAGKRKCIYNLRFLEEQDVNRFLTSFLS